MGISYQAYEQAIARLKGYSKPQAIKREQPAFIDNIRELLYEGNLYKRDLSSLKAWLEEAALKGNRGALYYKVQGIKYGIFGFTQDRKVANEYVLKYGIPY